MIHRFSFSRAAALFCAAGLCSACSLPAAADGDGEDPAAAAVAPPATAAAEPAAGSPIKVGIDSYVGVSNLEGSRRFSDGFWAGSAAAYPSLAYLRWDNGKGYAAKVSAGFGRMYTGPDSALDQPIEAWWQAPAGRGGGRVTVGKFWVPFGIQEWQYETKPGVMLQWGAGGGDIAVSANYNRVTRTANAYLRVGKSFGEQATVGVSLATGKGLSYDTDHDRAWALDGTFSWQGWSLGAEYDVLYAPGAKRFRFAYGKLSYERLGPWKPFVARYQWDDGAEQMGRFRSTVYGLNFRATPQLSVEGAYAPTSDKNVSWLQLHWTWER